MQLQAIQSKIYEIRGQKIMIDYDLAELYEVETRVLNQAVKRNINRFPIEFMFQLTKSEFDLIKPSIIYEEEILISQNVISKERRGGTQKMPFAFTEQGVAMLSAVLRSDKAIKVSISIMKAFVFLKQYAVNHKDLTEKLIELEGKFDKEFKDVYEAINYLLNKDKEEVEYKDRKQIGFKH